MVVRSTLWITYALGLLVSAYVVAPRTVAAQSAPLPAVPKYIPAALRDSLLAVRANLDSQLVAYRARKAAYDAACGLIPADQRATIDACAARHAAEISRVQALQKDKGAYVAFIARLDSLHALNPGWAKVDRVAPAEPPSPVIDEEAEFYKDPIGWRDRQELRVRHAVFLQKKWTGLVLKAIKERTPLPPATAVTRLSALSPGDVLLVAPVSAKYDPKEHDKGEAIALGDYALRAINAFANGGLADAVNVRRSDLSHSLTFIREVNGRQLFLDHDTQGTRVIDERQFMKDYAVREMLVARPQEVVDGRELWKAARDLALNQRGYGVTGDKVVCSQMCAIAVTRATKADYTAGNLGLIDVTPGDFYDKTGNVGKHFVVTRLNITPETKTK